MTTLAQRLRGWLDALNPEQREAVHHRGGPLLLLAGAGSGKTRVITVRIAYLVAQGTPPDAILAVTFTNRAAREMKERLAAMLGERAARAVTATTFHAFGASVLRSWGRRVGLDEGFEILDAADRLQAIEEAMQLARLDPKRYRPAWVGERISRAKSAGMRPDAAGTGLGDLAGVLVAETWAHYEELLRRWGAVDFDDLLVLPRRLLAGDAEVRAHYRASFQHVLVDEFQDTNAVQLELTQLLAGASGNVVAVGDDDQSIYAWRGARADNVLQFERYFPGARVLVLHRNYRSTAPILRAAGALIAQNRKRRAKVLESQVGDGIRPQFYRCADPAAEADFVARRVGMLLREGHGPGDVAILVRSHAQVRPIEEALRAGEIPYAVTGAMSFFERREVKDALAWLRLVHNPADDLAVRRALAFPPSGIGAALLRQLHDQARASHSTLYEALRHPRVALPARAEAGRRRFLDAVERVRHALHQGEPPGQVLAELFDTVGFRAALVRRASGGEEGAARRWERVSSLVDGVRRMSRPGVRDPLGDYLRSVSLERDGADEPDASRVHVITLHAAKGLEFPVVFICGVEEGILPWRRQGKASNVEEERRLLYVGMTRAKEQLVLTAASRRRRGRTTVRTVVSRFIDDMGSFIERHDAPGRRAQPRRPREPDVEAALARIARALGEPGSGE